MNAHEVAETTDVLRRSLVLVQTGQMSELAGCRIEGAVGAVKSIMGDPQHPFAQTRIEDSVRRLSARAEEGGMTEATAHRIEGALLAFRSVGGNASSLLACLGPRQTRLPTLNDPDDSQPMEVRVNRQGQPQSTQVQL